MTASCSLRSWAPFPEPACPAALTSTALRPGWAFLCSHPGLWHCTCTHTHMHTHTHRGMVCFQASRPPLPPDAHTRTHVHTHRGVVCFQAPGPPLSPDPQSHVLLGTWCPPLLLSLATGPTSRLSLSAQDLTNTEAAPGPGQASVGPLRGLPWVY